MKNLVWVAAVAGCTVGAEDREIVIRGDFDAIRVELGNGDLRIAEGPADEVRLEVEHGGVGRAERRLEDGVLVIDYGCRLCGGELDIEVPPGIAVDAVLRHGDLVLDGLSGPVSARVRAGRIAGDGLACDVDLFANAGAIELGWDFRPRAVVAETHLGAVTLDVPAGGYDLWARSTIGAVRLSDVFHDGDADGSIDARSHVGAVEIVGR